MCKSKCRLVLLLLCKLRKLCNYIHKLCANQFQCFCHNNNICIISYITGCSSKMDDSFCFRTLNTICINMRHNIMTYNLLTFLCHLKVNIIRMALHLFNLFIRDVESKLLLSLCQCDPKSSPCSELFVR